MCEAVEKDGNWEATPEPQREASFTSRRSLEAVTAAARPSGRPTPRLDSLPPPLLSAAARPGTHFFTYRIFVNVRALEFLTGWKVIFLIPKRKDSRLWVWMSDVVDFVLYLHLHVRNIMSVKTSTPTNDSSLGSSLT